MDKEQTQVTTESHIEESPVARIAYDFARQHGDTLLQVAEPANKNAEFLEYMDAQDPSSKIFCCILGHILNLPEARAQAVEYLNKWTAECLSEQGRNDITGSGFEDCIPQLAFLSKQGQQDDADEDEDESRIVAIFRKCSDREKFLIYAYMELSCAMNEHGSDEPLREATAFDESNVPADLEYLIGAVEGARLAVA